MPLDRCQENLPSKASALPIDDSGSFERCMIALYLSILQSSIVVLAAIARRSLIRFFEESETNFF